MNEFIFGIVLMIFSGQNPPNVDWKVANTKVYESGPQFKTSLDCQNMARGLNSMRSRRFIGDRNGPFNGVNGQIVGAWCIVPIKDKNLL